MECFSREELISWFMLNGYSYRYASSAASYIVSIDDAFKRIYESVHNIYDWKSPDSIDYTKDNRDLSPKPIPQKFVDKDKMWEAIKEVAGGK